MVPTGGADYAGPIKQSGSISETGGQVPRISEIRPPSLPRRFLSSGRSTVYVYGSRCIEVAPTAGRRRLRSPWVTLAPVLPGGAPPPHHFDSPRADVVPTA